MEPLAEQRRKLFVPRGGLPTERILASRREIKHDAASRQYLFKAIFEILVYFFLFTFGDKVEEGGQVLVV